MLDAHTDDDHDHDGHDLRAVANMLQVIFCEMTDSMKLCPECTSAFVTARMIAFWTYKTSEDDQPLDMTEFNKNLLQVGELALIELHRLRAAGGKVDGPLPQSITTYPRRNMH